MAARGRASYVSQVVPRHQGLSHQAITQNSLVNGSPPEMTRRFSGGSYGLADVGVVQRPGMQRYAPVLQQVPHNQMDLIAGDGMGVRFRETGRGGESVYNNPIRVDDRGAPPTGLSGGGLGAGGSHTHPSVGVRGGPGSSNPQEALALLQSQDMQLSDSVRSMYYNQGSSLQQAHPRSSADMSGFSAEGRESWKSGRDARLSYGGSFGRGDEAHLAPPMSPRRDEPPRMMSPRSDELVPPMSPRRDDYSRMMSPRRDETPPPPMSPRRDASFPHSAGPQAEMTNNSLMWGRMQPPMSPTREDEVVGRPSQRANYPMSPPRAPPRTPPMSPRWSGYEGMPSSPPRAAAPMSPRHSPPRTSQWDMLPGKRGLWSENEREPRQEIRLVADHYRGGDKPDPSRDDLKRHGQGWVIGRRGQVAEGGSLAPEDRNSSRRSSQVGPPFSDASRAQVGGSKFSDSATALPYGLPQRRAAAYHSVVNQRVGMTSKYIERERQERDRAAREMAGKSEKALKESGLKGGREGKDGSKNQPSSGKDHHSKSTGPVGSSLVAAIAAATEKHSSSTGKSSGAKGSGETVKMTPLQMMPVQAPAAMVTEKQNEKNIGVGSAQPKQSDKNVHKGGATGSKPPTVAASPIEAAAEKNFVKASVPEKNSLKAPAADKNPAKTFTPGSQANGNAAKQASEPIKPGNSNQRRKEARAAAAAARKAAAAAAAAGGSHSGVPPRAVGMGSSAGGNPYPPRGAPRSQLVDYRDTGKRLYPLPVSEMHGFKRARFSPMPRDARELEEMYYDANELSGDFRNRMSSAGLQYSQMINADPILRRRFQDGQAGELPCLVCGKINGNDTTYEVNQPGRASYVGGCRGTKTFSSMYELMNHARHSQIQGKRVEHMGFCSALSDLLMLRTTALPVNEGIAAYQFERPIPDTDDGVILWPPIVIVENTRIGLGVDRRWEGVTNSEMALLLHDLGHVHGKPKSIWDKFGHKGIVLVEYEPSLVGLHEAQRLEKHFQQNGRGRSQWNLIRPFGTGVPGNDHFPEGPDFERFDEVTNTKQRVFYGYLAHQKDLDKLDIKKKKRVNLVKLDEMEIKLKARQSGENVVI